MIFGQKKLGNSSEEGRKNTLRMMVLELATEFAFLIAVPLIVLVYLGNKLDRSHHTKFYVLIGLFVALAISTTAIAKRINYIRKNLK